MRVEEDSECVFVCAVLTRSESDQFGSVERGNWYREPIQSIEEGFHVRKLFRLAMERIFRRMAFVHIDADECVLDCG